MDTRAPLHLRQRIPVALPVGTRVSPDAFDCSQLIGRYQQLTSGGTVCGTGIIIEAHGVDIDGVPHIEILIEVGGDVSHVAYERLRRYLTA